MATELVGVAWENNIVSLIVNNLSTWGSASPRGGGDGGRRGGEGSAGAPSLVANPESGEGWAAPGCLGGGRLRRVDSRLS